MKTKSALILSFVMGIVFSAFITQTVSNPQLVTEANAADFKTTAKKKKSGSCKGTVLGNIAEKTYRILDEKQILFANEKKAIAKGYELENGSYE